MYPPKAAAILLFASLLQVVCVAQVASDAQLLGAAASQAQLWTPGKPYRLEADFVTQLQKPETGHVTLIWSAKDLWKEQISLAEYQEITVRNGEETSTARNLNFTPLSVREIQQLLASRAIASDQWSLKKVKRADKGTTVCLELRNVKTTSANWNREICLDPATLNVMSDQIAGPYSSRKKEFSDYHPFLGQPYPRTLKLTLDGEPVLTMVITLLEEQTFSASHFTPPPNAIVRRTCENMVHAKAIKTPDPISPLAKAQHHIEGTSIVALTVLPDGSVDDVHLVGSSNHDMDSVTQQIVKTWKFQPAMCGNEAVATDIQVEMRFKGR